MALTLSFSLGAGFRLETGEDDPIVFKVLDVGDQEDALIRCECTGEEFLIVSEKSVEIYPEVFVSEGFKQQSDVVKLVFRAPQKVLILRQDLAEG